MDLFKIDLKRSFEQDIKKIDKQFIPKIVEIVEGLSSNPFPPQSKKLKGSEASYRLRIGNYRIIYQVNTPSKLIVVYYVRHRKDAYKH